ncbi:MAG: flagellar hook capping FlgD N-terminal domain-containing protein [Bacillota bacterium]
MEVSKTGLIPSQTTQKSQSTSMMGKDDFLKLLVAQLKNQDPLSPMEDKEFIAQMAQFSSLEQMQNLSQGMDLTQALGMVGRTVEAAPSGSESVVTGIVQAVRISEGRPLLMVGDQQFELSDIVTIG